MSGVHIQVRLTATPTDVTPAATASLAVDEAVPIAIETRIPEQHPRSRRSRSRLLTSYGLTIWLLLSLNFFLPRALPGDPIEALQDPDSSTYVLDDALRAKLNRYYGLDRPLGRQYLSYVGGLVRGDLGVSTRYRVPVRDLIAQRLPWTALLMGTAMGAAIVVGLVAGVHSGWSRDRAVDRRLLGLFLGLRNLPAFFTGSLAVYFLSVKLGWFPLGGSSTPFADFPLLQRIGDVAHHLALPAAVLAVQFTAGYYLLMRAATVAELGSDYLVLGRAKGLRDRRLKYRYAARNALLPVVTVIGIQMGHALTGAVFIETVFSYRGMGRLLFDALGYRDYPTLQGCFLVLTVMVVLANALADALYARLDPRVVR